MSRTKTKLFAAILGLSNLALLSNSQQRQTFTIAGHIVRHLDQRAARGVRVSIAPAKSQEREVSTVTGDSGEFSFPGVPQGKFQLQVTDHGSTELYLQDEQYSTAIVTGPGLDTEHIVFPVDSGATLSGTIVDEENDPVPHASVYLFGNSLVKGSHRTRLSDQSSADNDGRFHFRHLLPGAYVLAVAGRPWYAQNFPLNPSKPGANSELDMAYPVTYYAEAASPEGATAIKLEEGSKTEVQMVLRAVPALHIKFDASDEARRQPGMVSQVGPGGLTLALPVSRSKSELLGIAPGNYVVLVQSFDPGQRPNSEMEEVSLTSDTILHVGDGVKTLIRGKLIWSGEMPTGLAVTLSAGFMTYSSETVRSDGSFGIFLPGGGRYDLGFANAPGTYLAKVDVRDAAFKNGELQIARGAQAELTLTAAHGLSEVEGKVMDEKNFVAGATVLLIPQDLAHGKTIERGQTDSDGTFTLKFVAPGRYTLVAIDSGRGLAYSDPGILAPYLEHGRTLDIPAAKVGGVQIQVQRRR
jgi:hypothetical protein